MIAFFLLCITFFELNGASAYIDAVFTKQHYKGIFFSEADFKIQSIVQVKAKGKPLEKLNFYFKQHTDTEELEFLVVWYDVPFSKITRLRGKHISNSDLRILFRAAKADEESESGNGLIGDVYCNIFALSGLSFTFDEKDLQKKIRNLAQRIRAGAYENSLAFTNGQNEHNNKVIKNKQL
jgi:hypothetical protein